MVDGSVRTRSFRTRAEADRRRSRLLVAQQDGERFDPVTAEPVSWAPAPASISVYEWCRQRLVQDWNEWSPRTRDSEVEGLCRLVALAVSADALPAPDRLRRHLDAALRPQADIDGDDERERWLSRWSMALDVLDAAKLAEIDRRLGEGDAGQPLAATTARRYRRIAKSCIQRAVEIELIPSNPWPPSRRGRSRRKTQRSTKAIDVRRLPDPDTMRSIMKRMANHQPASLMYQTMTAVGYYAGLRPSEVVMLRPRSLWLPASSWGRIAVVEADDGYEEPDDPKTGDRDVPIPAVLVDHLTQWICRTGCTDDEHLFRTRNGRVPSNWDRALRRTSTKVYGIPLSPYDCRHACATAWLRAGVPLGEAALRLGHSVETLVAYYVGALQGDDETANRRIDELLGDQPDDNHDDRSDDGDDSPGADA
jgi:integrase